MISMVCRFPTRLVLFKRFYSIEVIERLIASNSQIILSVVDVESHDEINRPLHKYFFQQIYEKRKKTSIRNRREWCEKKRAKSIKNV